NPITVLLGDGSGALSATTVLGTGKTGVAIASADLNLDGRPDVILADQGAGSVSFFVSSGGRFAGVSTSVTAAGNPIALATADFDGDGTPDLLSANHSGNTVSFFRGIGDGTFAEPLSAPVGDKPSGLAV